MAIGPGLKRRGAVLALFALALQLVLSFGHFHPEDFFGVSAPGKAAAQIAADGPQAPIPFSPLAPSHDDCAICVNLAIAQSTAMPTPPVLPPPRQTATAAVLARSAPSLLSASFLPFRSRAPPSV